MAHRLSCSEASGILLPRPGIEPISAVLQGGLLTTGPLGRSPRSYLALLSSLVTKQPLASEQGLQFGDLVGVEVPALPGRLQFGLIMCGIRAWMKGI